MLNYHNMKPEKQIICPICQNSKLYIFNLPNYSECGTCRMVFQNPMPSELELANLYKNYYQFAKTNPNAEYGYDNYEENRSPAIFEKHYLPWIKKYATDKTGKFLDFGCATGNLILALRNAGYANMEGCEFAADAFLPLQEKNIACYECKGLRDKSKKYKYVSLMDVIEHLREPEKDLKAISESLEEGGILFIETVNIDDFFVRYFHKEKWKGIASVHTFLFGITSLKEMLKQNGFVILEIKTYKMSGSFIKWVIIRFLSLFVKSIRNRYKNPSFQFTFGDGVRMVAQKIK